MTDLELAVSTFAERLVELIDQAKAEAAAEFTEERRLHEQALIELRREVKAAEARAAEAQAEAEDADARYEVLRDKLAGLLGA